MKMPIIFRDTLGERDVNSVLSLLQNTSVGKIKDKKRGGRWQCHQVLIMNGY